MKSRTAFRAIVVMTSLSLGLIWATAAAALGLMAGLFLSLGLGAFLVRGLSAIVRRVVRPSRPAQVPLFPGWVATTWLTALSAACAVVAYGVHEGAIGDVRGVDFVPLALPFTLLVVAAVRLAHDDLSASRPDVSDAVIGATDVLFDP